MAERFDLIGQRTQRLEKVRKLREIGVDPYPAHSQKDELNQTVKEKWEEFEGKEVSLTGRLMSWREHGKVVFGDLADESGKIQLVIKKDTLSENLSLGHIGWEHLGLLDVGDFLQALGEVTKTQTGEISILVKELTILSKAIRPLPTELQDKQQRYRRRYLDLVVNPERSDMFTRKAHFWEANRDFLRQKGFIEVEVPILENVTGGADARPFVTHHNALDSDFFLRISTELYQKRLIGGGFEKVFTLGPNFRNEGMDDEHLQEYYQVEWYWAYADYKDNMRLVKEMFRYMAQEVYKTTKFSTRGHTFDLSDEWEELEYVSSLQEAFGLDVLTASEDEILRVLNEKGVRLEGAINRNRLVDNLWKILRKDISGPAFVINEPKFMSPLAKSLPDNPELTERFHVIIAGSELGNGYSEINDPQDQLERFLDQQGLREAGDEEAQMLDVDFIEMLEYGMPPTSGYAHSERVFWFFEDVTAREGTLFPLVKHEIESNTRQIYGDDILSNSQSAGQVREQDKSKKMVLVLDRELSGWQLTNTIGHLTGYLGSRIGRGEYTSRSAFPTRDGGVIPTNSQYAIITLVADKKELYPLLEKVEKAGLPHLAYIQEMIDSGDDKEIVKLLKNQDKKDLKYLGIGLFGPIEEVDRLTKKFNLYGS